MLKVNELAKKSLKMFAPYFGVATANVANLAFSRYKDFMYII